MAIDKVVSASITADILETNFKNLVINGNMNQAQRGTSFTSASGYTLDRYTWTDDSTSVFTITQSTDVPSGQGFATSMKLDCTTANGSLGSTDQIRQVQKIEAQNLQFLRYGTSSAKSVTLSFWVKSNKTGIYCATLSQEDDSYASFTKEYTISSSDTWEKKTLTFDGDTGGVINNDNGAGIWLMFAFGAGSGRHITADQWNSSYGLSTSNQVNLADSTSNELYLTGVQLEVGTSATDFEFLPFDVNLQRCQRYYYREQGDSSDQRSVSNGMADTTSRYRGIVVFPTTMRTNVSVTEAGLETLRPGAVNNEVSLDATIDPSTNAVLLQLTTDSGTPYTAGDALTLRITNSTSSFVAFDAEL